MGEIGRAITVAAYYGKPGFNIGKQILTSVKWTWVQPAAAATLVLDRGAHTQNITPYIKHISNDRLKFKVDPETMKCSEPLKRPMCIMLGWLLSKPKHMMKYASLYLERGYDVVSVSCTPWQVMRPMNGVKVVARDLIRFMAQNGNRFVVHGFSVGGYVWSEGLVYAVANKELYKPVLDRVEAQVWDSVADITAVTVGVPSALFPNNKLLRSSTHLFLEWYLRVFSTVTAQYKRASDTYYSTPCRAPALFLLSSNDPVGTETNIRNACNTWLQMGIKCSWKCWKDSPHVLHYLYHTEEYTELLLAHLREHTSVLREPAPHDVCAREGTRARAAA